MSWRCTLIVRFLCLYLLLRLNCHLFLMLLILTKIGGLFGALVWVWILLEWIWDGRVRLVVRILRTAMCLWTAWQDAGLFRTWESWIIVAQILRTDLNLAIYREITLRVQRRILCLSELIVHFLHFSRPWTPAPVFGYITTSALVIISLRILQFCGFLVWTDRVAKLFKMWLFHILGRNWLILANCLLFEQLWLIPTTLL